MYPGSLPLIFNGSVPGHEKLFNVRRCSMYAGVQCTQVFNLAGSTVLIIYFIPHPIIEDN